MKKLLQKIQLAVKKANGNRRVRLIDDNDVLRCIGEAIQDGKARTGGGTVANAYFKKCFGPVYQSVVEATKTNDGIFLNIGLNNANKGSAQRPNPRYMHSNTEFILSKRQALHLSRQQRFFSGKYLPKHLHNILITKEDSIAAGNCEVYTERVAKLFPEQTFAPAKKVYDIVKRLFPEQIDRCVKAIIYAKTRSGV